ncbi:MAG: tetratricopeptide repeat protein [Candidatus Altiarchaeota archaeon]
MDKESKGLMSLLEKAEVDEALKYAEGMKDSRKASEILSDFAVAVVKHLYDYEIAEKLLKKAVSINPKDARSFFNLGVLYTEPALSIRDEARLADAERAYLRALKLKPDYLEAHYNLALFYHFLGRDDEAELEYAVFSDICDDKELVGGLKKVLSKKIRKIDLGRYMMD